jgi:transcriptional regulator with XRE-family HTH domain
MDRDPPIARRLKQARVRAGLSQRGLGIAAGIDVLSSSPRINQYEQGKRTPDFRTAERLAKVLGCPTSYFYIREEDIAEIVLLLDRMPSRQRRELLAKLRPIDRDGQRERGRGEGR